MLTEKRRADVSLIQQYIVQVIGERIAAEQEEEREILGNPNHVVTSTRMTLIELADLVGCSTNTILRNVKRLKARGVIYAKAYGPGGTIFGLQEHLNAQETPTALNHGDVKIQRYILQLVRERITAIQSFERKRLGDHDFVVSSIKMSLAELQDLLGCNYYTLTRNINLLKQQGVIDTQSNRTGTIFSLDPPPPRD